MSLVGRSQRTKTASAKGRYVNLCSAVDGSSRLAYTEPADEKAATAVAFFSRARAFFTAHGIHRILRVVTDCGANFRAVVFVRSPISWVSRTQRIKPYTHSGKVERYQHILAEELLYACTWPSVAERANRGLERPLQHRPHTAAGNRPPASRLRRNRHQRHGQEDVGHGSGKPSRRQAARRILAPCCA